MIHNFPISLHIDLSNDRIMTENGHEMYSELHNNNYVFELLLYLKQYTNKLLVVICVINKWLPITSPPFKKENICVYIYML